MYRQANLINPNDYLVRENLACALLRHSNFEEGFKFFESRLEKSNKQNISIGLLPFATRIELPLFLVVIVLIFLGGILGIILAKASNIFNRR